MKTSQAGAVPIVDAPQETDPGLLRRPANLGLLGASPIAACQGVVIGTLAGFADSGEPLVDFPGNPSNASLAAPTTVAVGPDDLGRRLVLQFIGADLRRPVVLGLLQSPEPTPSEAEAPAPDVELDGQRVTLTAQREIVLRCGKASITLTRAGKVLIRGAYLLSRSSGVNRIKGGSVQVN
jgi:hypothetical protein